MAYIKAHLFNSFEQANAAIEIINQGEGIPVSPDAVTTTYTQQQEHNGQVYIQADEVTAKYLGIPVDFEIINTDIEA
jgi:hypothetical protein